jgi:hypothetical protein
MTFSQCLLTSHSPCLKCQEMPAIIRCRIFLFSSRLSSKNLKVNMYRTLILPVVLYGCETWSLILREERKLRVFEDMALKRIFERRRDKVMWKWRSFHN